MADSRFPGAPSPGTLAIARRTEGDRVILALTGELDLSSVPMFEQELADVVAVDPGGVVLDLAGLGFMDSTGLQALLRARDRTSANGHDLFLRKGPHQVQRVFELTKTIDAFTFED